mmetsp:Transcript_156563/g.502538  ORF Transcript_156563/g.502538 Transcript_156563/m.502538 type:complete len:231 (+) Transcript_156563:269-961(+)
MPLPMAAEGVPLVAKRARWSLAATASEGAEAEAPERLDIGAVCGRGPAAGLAEAAAGADGAALRFGGRVRAPRELLVGLPVAGCEAPARGARRARAVPRVRGCDLALRQGDGGRLGAAAGLALRHSRAASRHTAGLRGAQAHAARRQRRRRRQQPTARGAARPGGRGPRALAGAVLRAPGLSRRRGRGGGHASGGGPMGLQHRGGGRLGHRRGSETALSAARRRRRQRLL